MVNWTLFEKKKGGIEQQTQQTWSLLDLGWNLWGSQKTDKYISILYWQSEKNY